jgi:phosphoribosylaminoimidazole-succinocarboxamide synthase
MSTIIETNIPEVPLLHRGKVRDIYDMGDKLLIVVSDRLSAFDVVLPDPIPDKGKVLNQITLFWYEQMADIMPSHLITSKVEEYPEVLQPYEDQLEGRSMLVKKCQPLAIEAIVRGYITGSGWKDYQASGKVCGHQLPEGLLESERLDNPLFTPSTKAEIGDHDENIDLEETKRILGEEMANKVAEVSLAIYNRGRDIAAKAGIIIADTKFEFGICDGELLIIDEVLTPDSSRFWPADEYEAGRGQNSYDKQFVRDYLLEIGFNKQPPAPSLPENILQGTRQRYVEALKRLSGQDLQ